MDLRYFILRIIILILRNIVANRRNAVRRRAVRIVCLLSLCIMILGLGGCGEAKNNEILDTKTAQVEKEMMNFTLELERFRGLSDAQLQEYISQIESYKKSNQITETQAKLNEDVITDWHEVEKQLGSFKEYGEFEFDSAGKTYTATLNVKYANRDAKLIYVISKKDFEVTGANVEMVYTLGEKMSKAGMNTLTGILIAPSYATSALFSISLRFSTSSSVILSSAPNTMPLLDME